MACNQISSFIGPVGGKDTTVKHSLNYEGVCDSCGISPATSVVFLRLKKENRSALMAEYERTEDNLHLQHFRAVLRWNPTQSQILVAQDWHNEFPYGNSEIDLEYECHSDSYDDESSVSDDEQFTDCSSISYSSSSDEESVYASSVDDVDLESTIVDFEPSEEEDRSSEVMSEESADEWDNADVPLIDSDDEDTDELILFQPTIQIFKNRPSAGCSNSTASEFHDIESNPGPPTAAVDVNNIVGNLEAEYNALKEECRQKDATIASYKQAMNMLGAAWGSANVGFVLYKATELYVGLLIANPGMEVSFMWCIKQTCLYFGLHIFTANAFLILAPFIFGVVMTLVWKFCGFSINMIKRALIATIGFTADLLACGAKFFVKMVFKLVWWVVGTAVPTLIQRAFEVSILIFTFVLRNAVNGVVTAAKKAARFTQYAKACWVASRHVRREENGANMGVEEEPQLTFFGYVTWRMSRFVELLKSGVNPENNIEFLTAWLLTMSVMGVLTVAEMIVLRRCFTDWLEQRRNLRRRNRAMSWPEYTELMALLPREPTLRAREVYHTRQGYDPRTSFASDPGYSSNNVGDGPTLNPNLDAWHTGNMTTSVTVSDKFGNVVAFYHVDGICRDNQIRLQTVDQAGECSICLEQTNTNTICSHYICSECALAQVINDGRCPVCRGGHFGAVEYGTRLYLDEEIQRQESTVDGVIDVRYAVRCESVGSAGDDFPVIDWDNFSVSTTSSEDSVDTMRRDVLERLDDALRTVEYSDIVDDLSNRDMLCIYRAMSDARIYIMMGMRE